MQGKHFKCSAPGAAVLLVTILLQAGVKAINLKVNAAADLALVDATMDGDVPAILKALRDGADIEKRDQYGFTALLRASAKGHGAATTTILRAGAIVDTKHVSFRTPLMYAANQGKLASVKALLEGGANPEVLDRDGKTALEHAETDAMKALLKEAIEKRSVKMESEEKTITVMQLTEIFQRHNPKKIAEIDTLLEKYKGKWKVLIKTARDKYGKKDEL